MNYVHPTSTVNARSAATEISNRLDITPGNEPKVGIILGTGWGDSLVLDNAKRIAFSDIPGFARLRPLEGHAREVIVGSLDGTQVVLLRGRVHLNEAPDSSMAEMVRLQTEMLIQLGAKTLIVTCAAGALNNRAAVGDIVRIDGFVSLFAPPMPLYGGEFCSPDDAIDDRLSLDAAMSFEGARVSSGGYAMVRGPFFEGRKYDKAAIARTGANLVGMSTLPEACIAALYRNEDPAKDVRILPLAYVTNDDKQEHSHEDNVKQAGTSAHLLGSFLRHCVSRIPANRR